VLHNKLLDKPVRKIHS